MMGVLGNAQLTTDPPPRVGGQILPVVGHGGGFALVSLLRRHRHPQPSLVCTALRRICVGGKGWSGLTPPNTVQGLFAGRCVHPVGAAGQQCRAGVPWGVPLGASFARPGPSPPSMAPPPPKRKGKRRPFSETGEGSATEPPGRPGPRAYLAPLPDDIGAPRPPGSFLPLV